MAIGTKEMVVQDWHENVLKPHMPPNIMFDKGHFKHPSTTQKTHLDLFDWSKTEKDMPSDSKKTGKLIRIAEKLTALAWSEYVEKGVINPERDFGLKCRKHPENEKPLDLDIFDWSTLEDDNNPMNKKIVSELLKIAKLISSMPKVGDKVKIMGMDSIVMKTEVIDGVRYDLFKSASDERAAIRVMDEDSGHVVALSQIPNYKIAEIKFDREVNVAKRI